MDNSELKKVRIKNRTCYHFDNIIKFQDFDLHNILLDKKPWKYFSLGHFTQKFNWCKNLYISGSIKQMNFIMMGLDYLVLKNRVLSTIEVDILLAKKLALHVFSDYYAKIKVDSYDFIPLK